MVVSQWSLRQPSHNITITKATATIILTERPCRSYHPFLLIKPATLIPITTHSFHSPPSRIADVQTNYLDRTQVQPDRVGSDQSRWLLNITRPQRRIRRASMGTTRVLLPRRRSGLATVSPEVENLEEHGEEGEDAIYRLVSFVLHTL